MDFDSLLQSIQALPKWVQIWVAVLAVVNLLSIFFLRHAAGRVVFVFLLIIAAINVWLFMQHGLTRILSFPHFLWVPMIIWLGLMARRPTDTGLLRSWLVVLVLVNCISLAFDTLEVVRWLAGARGVMGAG